MKFVYEYAFDDGRREVVDLTIADASLVMEPLPLDGEVAWAKLTCRQCKACTLSADAYEYCPVARNLAHVLPRFRNDMSYTPVLVRVTAPNRIMEKKCSLETGISAIMGLIMASSGCPVLDVLRPMVFTHLPFATEDETLFRAVSCFLVGQYLRNASGLSPDWDVRNLQSLYVRISSLNADFSERLRVLQGRDASLTALITLDLFAQFGQFSLPESWVQSVKGFYSAYLEN